MPFLPLPDPWLVIIALICAVAPLLSLLVGSEMGAPRRSTGRSAAITALLLMALWTGGRYLAYTRAVAVLNSRLYDRQTPKRVEAVPNRWNPLAWRGLVETEKFTREVPVELWREFDPDAGRTHYPPDDIEAVQSLEASEAYIRARSRMRWPVTQVIPGEQMREITRYDLVTGVEVRLLVPNRPGAPAMIPAPDATAVPK
ncbi:MAG: hypothetical protein NTV70_03105 [Acidobacteria bacterium]|nr:hypothetical protein [Acidobacteriota bacterium]